MSNRTESMTVAGWTEEERLVALHRLRILDTPEEPAFDRVVNLARRIFGVPISLVSLVDRDRQWFKARCGIDAHGTERSASFCAHAIREPDRPFVIPDALADPRFRDNRLVTGMPHIRFYAGVVVRSPEGLPLGTVCIIDQQPRDGLTDYERENLIDLAAMTADELQLREARHELEAKIEEIDSINRDLSTLLERQNHEIALAAQAQRLILPPLSRKTPGFKKSSLLLPSFLMSGDSYGFGPLSDTHGFFWLADVSGHGIAAALLATTLSRIVTGELLYESASDHVVGPQEVLRRLNARLGLWEDDDSYFTMIYGFVDARSGYLHLAVAGHPPPLLLTPDGHVDVLDLSGLPIGMFEEHECQGASLAVAPGSRLVVYSDGVIEAESPTGDVFGSEKLRDWLHETRGLDASDALEQLRLRLSEWSSGALVDDATLLVVDIEAEILSGA